MDLHCKIKITHLLLKCEEGISYLYGLYLLENAPQIIPFTGLGIMIYY